MATKPPQDHPREAWSVLIVSTLAFTVCFMVWMMFGVIGIPIKQTLGLNATEFGLLTATPVRTGSLIRVPLGIWTDRYGGRVVMALLMAATVPAIWLMAYATQFWHFLVIGLFVGLAGGSFSVGTPYVARWFPPRRQGMAMGIYGAGNSGSAVNKFVAPVLLAAGGWALVPQVYAAVMQGTVIVFWLGSHSDPAHLVPAQTKFSEQLKMLKDPKVLKYCQYYSIVFGGYVALALWMVQYYVGEFGLSIQTAALLAARFIGAHTTGFEALRDRVREFTPAHAAKVCGLKADDIVQTARWFGGLHGGGAARTPTLSLYCQGLNQSSSGTDKNSTLINLHLATGQIGKPGAGPLSLTGQPNAMGGREVGGLANLLGGHRDLADPAHRAEVAALWGLAEVPARPGKSAVQMFEAAADGEIKALWVVCTNPAQSMPDQATVRRAFERAELVVVQDAYAHTATTALADLVLPAASWGEKSGTVTNSERRISRVCAALPPPGEAREEWRIAVDVARRLEARLPRRRIDGASLFPYETPEAIWNEHRESTRGRHLDITGLSYAALEAPQCWPWPEGATSAQLRLLTLVVYMGVLRLQAIVDALTAAGMAADTPAAVVSQAHTPGQRHALCRLSSLAATVAVQGLCSPAILVIGDVVSAAPLWAGLLREEAAAQPPARTCFLAGA